MQCHVCNTDVGEGQRFCHLCGQSLAGVTDATQEMPVPVPPTADPDEESWAEQSPDTVAVTEMAGSPDTEAIPAAELPDAGLADTQAIPAAELPGAAPVPDEPAAVAAAVPAGRIDVPDATPPELAAMAPPIAQPVEYDSTNMLPAQGAPLYDDAVATTDQQPLVYGPGVGLGASPTQREGFRLRPGLIFAFLALIATLMASVADITDIRTDRVVAGITNRLTTLADIGSNLAIGGVIGTGLLLVGALLQCFGLRWGAGLAGGAGLAVAGWAALAIGLAEVPINSAEIITRDPSTPGPFTLTITRDLGYWLLVAVAVLGLVVFALSLVSAGTGGGRGLNPWTAALGAVAALVIAIGPLITVGTAKFEVNFGASGLPAEFFAGRLVQVGFIALTGVVGFLLVRTYGLGLAAGGASVPIWLWLSSLLEIGERPLGIAAGNLGSTDTSPHAVTTVGVALTVVMLVVAATLAIVQRSQSRD